MKDVFKTMVNHPIATLIIGATFFDGVAGIIRAVKGDKVNPGLEIQFNNPKSTAVD